MLLIRCEEIAPFPVALIKQMLAEEDVADEAEFTWMQEEPMN